MRALLSTGKVKLVHNKPFFNEFLIQIKERDTFFDKAIKQGILPGIKVDDDKLLIAVTEKRTKEEIDTLVGLL